MTSGTHRSDRTDFTYYLTVRRLSLLNGFTFVSVFFRFHFSKSFPLQLFLVPYSYQLLFTPLLVCFFVNQPHYHRFFQFFGFTNFYYLRQVNEVNGGDNVFVRCVSVCVCVCARSRPVGI